MRASGGTASAALQAELEREKQRATELEKALADRQGELKDAKAEAAQARATRDTAEAEARNLRVELQKSEKLASRAEDLERRSKELQRELDEARKRAEKRISALENEVEEQTRQLKQAQAGNAEKEQAIRKLKDELEAKRADKSEVEALERRHAKAASELARSGGALATARAAAEKAQKEAEDLKKKAEQAAEQRHMADKQLAETKARLDSERQIREEQNQRLRHLEESLARERHAVDSRSPSAALESLTSQLESERDMWERDAAAQTAEIEALQAKLAEAELRENELASQLEGVELSQQDVMRAKALAGQRRAQIERMQADVESARRQARESEEYWKAELEAFRLAVGEHLEAAERGDEGSDLRLQKLMEDLKVGLADKYAKLRRRNNKVEKDLRDTGDKLAAIERILAKREAEEARLRQIIDKLESDEKVPGAGTAKKKPAKKNPAKSKSRKKK